MTCLFILARLTEVMTKLRIFGGTAALQIAKKGQFVHGTPDGRGGTRGCCAAAAADAAHGLVTGPGGPRTLRVRVTAPAAFQMA